MSRLAAVLCTAAMLTGCVLAGPHSTKAPELPKSSPDGTRYVLVRGAWLRVLDTGPEEPRQPPLLLVHGYGSRLETWRNIQAEMSRERRVVSFDQRGFGLSEKPKGPYGPNVHSEDVINLMEQLGLDHPVVVGHSYGGGVVLRTALAVESRLSGIVLVSTYALSSQVGRSFKWAKVPVLGEAMFALTFRDWPGEKFVGAFQDGRRFATPEAIAEYRENQFRTGALYAGLETVRGMDYEHYEGRYGDLRLPVQLVYGEDDKVTTLDNAKDLVARIDGARLTVLERCGHVPPWERPRAVVDVIRDFLRRVATVPRRTP